MHPAFKENGPIAKFIIILHSFIENIKIICLFPYYTRLVFHTQSEQYMEIEMDNWNFLNIFYTLHQSSTIRAFYTSYCSYSAFQLHSSFSTLLIFYTPHFPHSAFSTLRTPHIPPIRQSERNRQSEAGLSANQKP